MRLQCVIGLLQGRAVYCSPGRVIMLTVTVPFSQVIAIYETITYCEQIKQLEHAKIASSTRHATSPKT